MREHATPVPSHRTVRFGNAELLRDLDRVNGWLLTVDGIAQSYVDLDDPTHLEFDYVRAIAGVLDVLPPEGGPLDVIHIGGAGCTLPRYLAETRPGSRQLVVDTDAELIELVREQLGLDIPGVAIRVADGGTVLPAMADDLADLVILDAFEAAVMADDLVTPAFTSEIVRVLRPGGTHVVNISGEPGDAYVRHVVATVTDQFAHTLHLGDATAPKDRRFGNLVLISSDRDLTGGSTHRFG